MFLKVSSDSNHSVIAFSDYAGFCDLLIYLPFFLTEIKKNCHSDEALSIFFSVYSFHLRSQITCMFLTVFITTFTLPQIRKRYYCSSSCLFLLNSKFNYVNKHT